MSRSYLLDVQHQDGGLLYQEVGLEFRVQKHRIRWQVTVSRDGVALGVDTLNLADARARRALVRNLRGVEEVQREVVESVLVALTLRVGGDWEEHTVWKLSQHQRHLELLDEANKQILQQVAEDRRRQLEQSTVERLEDPALLYRVLCAVAEQGVVREERNILLTYLAITSRLTMSPISLFVKGESSGGKSHLVATVLSLFPDSTHIDLTSVSEKGLIYDERPYSHRTIVFYEAHGQGNEFVNYLIRTLLAKDRSGI
jgi:hypothetical protein